MKLQKMTDFVLEQTNKITNEWSEDDQIRLLDKISNHANFLKQPLKLEMFVPCDEYGNVLECPHNYGLFNLYPTGSDSMDLSFKNALEYQQAKEKVLFEGFKIYKYKKDCIIKDNTLIFEWLGNRFSHTGTTIESLTLSHDNFYLTPNAIKQLGL